MPVKPLRENNNWLAINHPQPEYPLHILILPKRAIESLLDTLTMDVAVYQSFFEIVTALIKQFNLEQQGYRLITNGGPNQIIPQWHWHLISDYVDAGAPLYDDVSQT